MEKLGEPTATLYRYKQADGRAIFVLTALGLIFYRGFEVYFSFGLSFGLSAALALVLAIVLLPYSVTEVAFGENYLYLTRPFRSPLAIPYDLIDKATYQHNRFRNFFVFAGNQKVRLPPPLKMLEVEALFAWLSTRNARMQTEIIYPSEA